MGAPTEKKHTETPSAEDQMQPMNPESSSTFGFSPLDLPIGYRFSPKDHELIYILHLRQQNVFSNHPIHHVNVYDSTPQHLSERYEKDNDKDEWFFLTERTKVRQGGKNHKRGNDEGYWDARTPIERIAAGNRLIGYMRQLNYVAGKKPNCTKTNWRMNEYWINKSSHDNNDKVEYALCKIFVTKRKTKKNKSEEADEAVENEENAAIGNQDGEYQAHDQIMPQSDHMMMMIPEGEQQQQQVGQIFEPNPPNVEYQEPQHPPLFAQMMPEGEQQQQVMWNPLLSAQVMPEGEQQQQQFMWNPPLFAQMMPEREQQQQQFMWNPLRFSQMMPEGEQPQQQVTWAPPLFAQHPQGQDYFEPNPQIVPHSLMMVQEGDQQQEQQQQQVTQSPLLPPQDPDDIIRPDDQDYGNSFADQFLNIEKWEEL